MKRTIPALICPRNLLILGLLLAGIWFLWSPPGLELRIEPLAGGEPLLVAPMEFGEEFTLNYVHSVDRKPIWEVHSVDRDGRIFIEEERFVMVGAGMGDLPGRGQWTGQEGLQSVKGMHYLIGDFVLRIGSPGVDHTILWRNTRTNLSALAAGTAVRVRARPVSRVYSIWRRLVPHPATPLSGAVNVRNTQSSTG
jgi:hypothetical protein